MERGHYGQYTGNAKHSRKEEMIHDRELIYDAKKQLHNADQDYKKDGPHMEGKKKGAVAYMSDELTDMPLDKDMTGGRSAAMMHDEFTRSKGITHAPVKKYGEIKKAPAKNMDEVIKGKLRK